MQLKEIAWGWIWDVTGCLSFSANDDFVLCFISVSSFLFPHSTKGRLSGPPYRPLIQVEADDVVGNIS